MARAQARATGAEAHELYSLIASYYGFSEMAATTPDCSWRVQVVEHRLRTFCRTGKLVRGAVVPPEVVCDHAVELASA